MSDTRLVEVEITTRIQIEVPADWDPGQVERRYNESGWCADNLPDIITDHIRRRYQEIDPSYQPDADPDLDGIGVCSGLCDVTTVRPINPAVFVLAPTDGPRPAIG